jgi:hypothetical protein
LLSSSLKKSQRAPVHGWGETIKFNFGDIVYDGMNRTTEI